MSLLEWVPTIDLRTILMILGVSFGVIVWIWHRAKHMASTELDFGMIKDKVGKIDGLEHRMLNMETKMELFWKVMESAMCKLIPGTKNPINIPELLSKVSDKSITTEELIDLRKELTVKINKAKSRTDILSLAFMVARIEQIMYDVSNNGPMDQSGLNQGEEIQK